MTVLYPRKRRFRKPILFQKSPAQGDKINHGFNWCTIEGQKAAGRRLVGQAIANEQLIGKPYAHVGTIKVLKELSVKEIKTLWGQISRALRKAGCEYLWIIEVTPSNKIDWHLVFRDAPADLMKSRGRKLKARIKAKTSVPLNIQFAPFKKKSRSWLNYICKAKINGTREHKPISSDDVDDVANSNTTTFISDLYEAKRVLFLPKIGLNKYGATEGFWEASPAELTKAWKAKKKKRQQAINIIDTAAKRLADLTNMHETYVTNKLAQEWEANPNDKELRKQNQQLADDWLRSTPEYEEEIEATKAFEQRFDMPI